MKRFIKSEKLIYSVIAAAFLCAFLAVYIKTEQRLVALNEAAPVVIHDVTEKENENESRTVYITASGKKYHLDGCDYLGEKRIAVSEKEAKNADFESCKYCQP